MMAMPLAMKDNICTEGVRDDLRLPDARDLRAAL